MATEHKDIRIEFTLAGRNYEAVGFLDKDELTIDGDEMIRRTNGGDNVANEDDWKFIGEHRRDLPTELVGYLLVTNRLMSDSPRSVSCFKWEDNAWSEYWRWLVLQWHDDCLVVRRRP